MYPYQREENLGALGQAEVIKKVGGTAASTIAKWGASSATTYFGATAWAGPVGLVVGGLVTIFMSLFGHRKIKKPVFGLALILPSGIPPNIGSLMKALNHFVAISGLIPGPKDFGGSEGAIGITEGGVFKAHAAVAGEISNIVQYQKEMAAPFIKLLDGAPPEIMDKILLAPVSMYGDARSYMGRYAYYWTGSIPQGTVAWVLSNTRDINSAVNEGYNRISSSIKKAYDDALAPFKGMTPETPGTPIEPKVAQKAVAQALGLGGGLGAMDTTTFLVLGGLGVVSAILLSKR